MNGPIDALVSELLQQTRSIARDVLRREGVRLRTATVTSTDPLQIQYDGETTASVVPPRRAVVVSLGDRVVVAKSRGQATILGVLGEPKWVRVQLEPGLNYPGHGFYLSIKRDGARRYLRGRVGKTSGNFEPGDTLVAKLEPQDLPTQATGGLGNVASFASPGYARLELQADGSLFAAPNKTTGWIGFDSITWDVY